MTSKLDPILADITVRQLALVEDQLTNNEESSDGELQTLFIESGMTAAQAQRALTYRTRYSQHIYEPGATPILAGDDAYRYDPRTGRCTKESSEDSTNSPRVRKQL